LETRAEAFAATRPLLFSVAYRMLGSVMDAEDLVQEAYLRWQEAPNAEVRSPRAYLVTIVTRLAINQLRSARSSGCWSNRRLWGRSSGSPPREELGNPRPAKGSR